ncbi:MAG TPA: tetratricopeptide repeat protein [Oculatellaceae cyanobacterium]
MTGTKRSGSKNKLQLGTMSFVLSSVALASLSMPSVFAAGKALPIERIGLDNARQLVIQFANEPGSFPPVPNVLDMPGPNHRVVVEFTDATIDRAKIPTAEQMTSAMHKILPQVKAIRYTLVPNAAKPTTRIVLELPEDLDVSARVVKMEEDSVTINLGQAVRDLVIEDKEPATKRRVASAPVPSAQAPGRSADTVSGASSTDDEAPVMQASAPVARASAPAPVAAAPVQQSSFQVTSPAVPSSPAQSDGQTTVSAGGETVALKPEQKIDQPKASTPSTKGGANQSGWDWNSSMDNELASKIAETKSMGDGGPLPVANNKLDSDEQALINKVEKEEVGTPSKAAPVAQLREVPTTTNVAATAEVAEATPAVQTRAAEPTTPAVQAQAAEPTTPSVQPRTAEPTISAAPEAPASRSQMAESPATQSSAPVAQETPVVAQETPAVAQAPAASEAPLAQTEPPLSQPKAAETVTDSDAMPETASAAKAPVSVQNDPAAALTLYNAAVKNHLTGKLAEAISDYKNALAANPEMAEAHSNLGMIYNQQHNYDGALSEFRKALAINPRDAITYNGIGAALRAENDLPGAIKNWQTAVDIDPKLATAHYNLGTAYEKQKDYDKALNAYGDAVRNDVRLGEAFYRMGWILQQKHQFQDAEANYNQALKINPKADYCVDAQKRIADLAQKK